MLEFILALVTFLLFIVHNLLGGFAGFSLFVRFRIDRAAD